MEYEFRVQAVDSAGYCQPSLPSAVGKLKSSISKCYKLIFLVEGFRRIYKISFLRWNFINLDKWEGAAPSKPYITFMDTDRVLLEWDPAVTDPNCAPIAGYEVVSFLLL